MEALNNLKDFKEVADMIGIPFMLAEGTLLGAYRDKGFVKDDENDIDLMILDDHWDDMDVLDGKLKAKGFEFSKGFTVNGKFQGGCFTRGWNHIDIMRMLKEGDEVFNYGEGGGLKYTFQADIFEKYDEIEFYGVKYLTPGKIEKFLETRYGDWKTPVSKADYSYKDPKYSPNVEKV